MAFFAEQIANVFIERGLASGINVDPLKVQKLVYFSHGWNLTFLRKPLIRQTVEAWRYGPVVPDLYRQFRNFGSSTITSAVSHRPEWQPIDDRSMSLLDEIWKKYGHMGGIELSAITHEQGCAWDLARRGNEGNWNNPEIPNEWIRDEFDRRLARG